MDRTVWYSDFRDRVRTCGACSARKEANVPVPSVGNLEADVFLIGRNPGKDEDREGIPFVGRAGGFLTKALSSVYLSRDDVYIANLNKCYMRRNRLPKRDEVVTCFRRFLHDELQTISPKVVVAFGATVCQYLLGIDNISKNSGKLIQHKAGFLAVASVHPASVCYGFEENWPKLLKAMQVARRAVMR